MITPPPLKEKDSAWIALGLYGAIGFQWVFFVVGGLFLGKKLDDWLQTKPWLLFLCLLGGMALGLFQMLRLLSVKDKKNGEK